MSTSWDLETDPRRFRSAVLFYCTGTSNQRNNTENRRYQNTRRGAAATELHRDRGGSFVADGFQFVAHQQYERVSSDRSKLRFAYFWYKKRDNISWLGIIYTLESASEPFVVWFLKDLGPVKIIDCVVSCIPVTRRLGDFPGVSSIASPAGSCLV